MDEKKIIENTINDIEAQEEEISQEEMEEMIYDMVEEIANERVSSMIKDLTDVDVKLDGIKGNKLDAKLYKEGLKEVSKMVGMMAGLKAIGLDAKTAAEMVMTSMTISHNQELQKINNAHAEKMLKIQVEGEDI